MGNNKPEKPLEILLVDDNEKMIERYKLLLEENIKGCTYHMNTARNGALALKKVKEKGSYDLIITDYAMPEMSGIAFYKELDKAQQKRVVLVSLDANDIKKSLKLLLDKTDYQSLPVLEKAELSEKLKETIIPILTHFK
nr:response regulator [Nanoarchaeota archaeon]